uniref:DH domain-containing protein n=1 Tax=Ditylenchus dipsaci TaxID=166011 RepID=A0A915EIX1_9BILA
MFAPQLIQEKFFAKESTIWRSLSERANPEFRKTYRACCQHGFAKGVSLSYHLLLPMARITRYPLIFEKMVKYSSAESQQYESLQNAYQLLKALCARTNAGVYLAHREIGARSFVHAGILYKTKSNRMLVGLLYSDFLLLATPNHPILEPDFAKITKNTDISLTLYKTPLMVKNLMVLPSSEDNSFQLKTGDFVTSLKAPNSSARILWMTNAEEIRMNSHLKQPTLH